MSVLHCSSLAPYTVRVYFIATEDEILFWRYKTGSQTNSIGVGTRI
jgi:hypothetical protein